MDEQYRTMMQSWPGIFYDVNLLITCFAQTKTPAFAGVFYLSERIGINSRRIKPVHHAG
ncbi:hypothetical protein Hneap_2355 [Halothiobacillus neapolitanus c2]|uniref:Uncharacterized protein n=1 Tax=Halothiobacillus neapolitanus (strain ATCC 23641 / DSM 15147 / CIP 104769 / NCIMB 8539 / c2) TaxID=555778 RepID=D0KX44_HALNC|nr:hypothetical protein Hneap_2355 [Halothiobacillus neapolitanus c2]TDN60300.1 hypothetical protein C8D83_10455 [Halothiobacillus neapolitanus]